MTPERVFTRPLLAFLFAVAVILAVASRGKWWPWSVEGVVAELRDGDLEGRERRARLRFLLADGAAAAPQETARRQRAVLAAIALDDERQWQEHGAGWQPWTSAAAAAELGGLSFGDEVVDALVAAIAAEAGGERELARRSYERAAMSSRLFHMRVAERLCRAGMDRLH